jgi:hypothetical protein
MENEEMLLECLKGWWANNRKSLADKIAQVKGERE